MSSYLIIQKQNLLVNCVLMQRNNNENVIMLWNNMILVFLLLECFVFGLVVFLL